MTLRARDVRKDILAGLTVSAISLPQSIAYALIAGVDPRFGLYAAIVFAAVASIFGSSRHLVNGPTGAVSLVVFSALSFIDPQARLDAYEAMFLLAAMVGAIQIAISVLRLGDLTRYISESVISGFLYGAAILTIVGQIGNALGLKSQGSGHQHVFHRLWLTLTQAAPINPKALAISGGAIVLALVARRIVRRYRLPQIDMLVVLLLVAVPAYLAGWTQVDAAGKAAVSLIQLVPGSLPTPHIPEIRGAWLGPLSSSAFAIALLGLLETLAIAKAIAAKTGQTLDFNRQCLAEGLGNLVGGFFRCMPGAGSLSRSAVNHQAGAVTKLSGVCAAGFVAVLLLVFAPLTRHIPSAALAGLLIVAAARLIDLERLRYVVRASLYDGALLIATGLAALIIGVEFAILIGVLISILLYVPRAAKLKVAELTVTEERIVRERLPGQPRCTAIAIRDLEGELFFGSAPELEHHLDDAIEQVRADGIQHLVLRLKRLRNPDAVCLEVLERFLKHAQAEGITVLLAGVRPDLTRAFARLGLADWFPAASVFAEASDEDSATLLAVRSAYDLLGADNHCAHCARPAERTSVAYYLV